MSRILLRFHDDSRIPDPDEPRVGPSGREIWERLRAKKLEQETDNAEVQERASLTRFDKWQMGRRRAAVDDDVEADEQDLDPEYRLSDGTHVPPEVARHVKNIRREWQRTSQAIVATGRPYWL